MTDVVSIPRDRTTSSFTIIKGSLIDETYEVFREWDFALSKRDNLTRVKETNSIGARSEHWLRDVAKVINRRFDPGGVDRPLVELAQGDVDRESWKPLLLWHMTRDEFLVRDFLVNWLYPRLLDGTFRFAAEDLHPYLESLPAQGVTAVSSWSRSTLSRVASGLLRIATDFGLLTGTQVRELASYHLPEPSFLYVLHSLVDIEPNPGRVVHSDDWHMYFMSSDDVEHELLRLHQFHRLRYEAAGSLARLELPFESAAAFARSLV